MSHPLRTRGHCIRVLAPVHVASVATREPACSVLSKQAHSI